MSFFIKDKYNNIWDVIKYKLSIKFHSKPVYDETYIKISEFDSKIKTNFLGDGMPKENTNNTSIACITIDFFMRMDKKNHQEPHLEECKYKIKNVQMPRFINVELKSDLESELESDSEAESKPDTELMAKLKSDSDSE